MQVPLAYRECKQQRENCANHQESAYKHIRWHKNERSQREAADKRIQEGHS